MLIATLLSALAITANTPDPWACDLAPSLGQGTSDEGSIESITTISFACRYELFSVFGVGISPLVGLDRQMWSVYESSSDGKNISTYETQDFQFGLRLDRSLSEKTKIFYSFASGSGRGSLEKTESTESSSINGSYDGLTQTFLSHTLGASYGLTEKLDLTLAWQRQDAKQKWTANSNDLFIQNVGANNALTLSDGATTNLVGPSVRTSNSRTTNAIQIGLSLRFGS